MATFRDLRLYATNDGWTEEPNLAHGRRRIGEHQRFFRDLADGTRLRTKVPHDEQAEVGQDLFRHILRDQLRVTDQRFWEVVHGRSEENVEAAAPTVEPIPGWLVTRLLFTVGLSEADVAPMTADDARTVWAEYQTRTREGA